MLERYSSEVLCCCVNGDAAYKLSFHSFSPRPLTAAAKHGAPQARPHKLKPLVLRRRRAQDHAARRRGAPLLARRPLAERSCLGLKGLRT